MRPITLAVVVMLCAGPAFAQIGQITRGLEQAQKGKDLFDATKITEQEEQQIGAQVSEKLRAKYGVVQDAAVHKYVSLVGSLIAQATTRPKLPWTFIVLDTDGVNAFASPGGYIHITRGALGLIRNEAELAGVLGHEITHVTAKHTLAAIKKGKLVQAGTSATLADKTIFLEQLANKTYDLVLENSFDRDDERESDETGIRLANKVGYSPAGLPQFLQMLADRNKNGTQKSGLFASHPEINSRIERLNKQIRSERLTATATVEARYKKFITYEAKPQAEIATVVAGAAGLAGETAPAKTEEAKKPEQKKRGFGLGALLKPGGSEKQSAQVTASGGARGVGDPERDAKGGPDPKIVAVSLTPAEIEEFKKGITG